ncbi:MAG TPA: SDR family oxidoreductase [Candidatus Saccharimonadales bacterium]|nr:SDR family oxidoreductase [Candidatus Saccharimonadales bacterium]
MKKIVLITGGSDGIGKATAIGLARKDFHVVIVGRNKDKTEAAVQEIKQLSGNKDVDYLLCDLSLLSQVQKLAKEFGAKYKRLDVLINNAGVFLPSRQVTEEGFEKTFATNYLSHFLLTHLLLPLLEKSAPSRIVCVASKHQGVTIDFDDLMLEKRKYSFMKAVGPTKLGLVLFTKTLSKKLEGSGVTINCLHPGLTRSHLLDKLPFIKILFNFISGTPEKGAQTSIYLASSPEVEGISGEYFEKCKVAKTVGQANDPDAEKKLWDVSLKLAKIANF